MNIEMRLKELRERQEAQGARTVEFDKEQASQADKLALFPELVRALEFIANCAGNLPDEELETRTGPNDARHRGLMVISARAIARGTLAKVKGGGGS